MAVGRKLILPPCILTYTLPHLILKQGGTGPTVVGVRCGDLESFGRTNGAPYGTSGHGENPAWTARAETRQGLDIWAVSFS